MLTTLTLAAYCLLTPALVQWLTHKYSALAKIGSITLVYVVGCLVGLSDVFYRLGSPAEIKAVFTTISSAAVPLAIPLMLFSSDVRSWRHLAPNFVKSLCMGLLACVLVAVAGFYLFGQADPEKYAGVSAMFVGLYTGGTANMVTIKEVAGVADDTLLLAQIYQILVGAIYLVVIIVFGKYIAALILPPFKHTQAESGLACEAATQAKKESKQFTKENAKGLALALGLTLFILGCGFVATLPFGKDAFMAIFMLAISTLAIAASFSKRVNGIPHTFGVGIYLILVFSIAVASQVGSDMFSNLDRGFFLYVSFVTLAPLFLHILLNALLRVDADTTLVSSIALVTSPAFVPVMAGTLRNREVVGPGITVGLIGYALGTYIGFGVYRLLLALI